MIDLSWNTRGRVSLPDYRKARWRHFFFCLIPIGLYIAAAVGASAMPVWASITLFSTSTILLLYYRYRFLQVMVRRLHDRNMSGKLLVLSPLFMFGFLGALGYFVLSDTGSSGFAAEVSHWMDGNGQIAIWAMIIPFVAFSYFLRYQMNREGTPDANKYGSPGTTQANMF